MKIQIRHIKKKLRKKFKSYSMKNLSQKSEYDILLEGTETTSLYAKPKTHKAYQDILTFRLICIDIGSCSLHMSEFMDSFLQPLNRKNCSYVKDTTDFLNKVSKIHNSPDIEKNLSMDV